MEDLAALQPARVLDTTGKLCPVPIIETAKLMRELKPGEVALVISTDPGIESDMPAWCKSARQEYLGLAREGRTFRAYVRKKESA